MYSRLGIDIISTGLPCVGTVPGFSVGRRQRCQRDCTPAVTEIVGRIRDGVFFSDLFLSGLTRDGWSVTVMVIAAAGSGVAGWFCVETGMVPMLVAVRLIMVIGRGGEGKRMVNA
jgi:hypothetical protein